MASEREREREQSGVEMEGREGGREGEGQPQKILGGLASKAVGHGQPLLNKLGNRALKFRDFAEICVVVKGAHLDILFYPQPYLTLSAFTPKTPGLTHMRL